VVRAPGQAAPHGLVWPSDLRWCSSSSQLDQLDLKHLYKDPLRCSLEEAVEKHETEKRRLIQQRLEGETLSESPSVASLTSSTSPTPSPWWIGSSPPLDYEFVAVACSISLLCYDV
jgi:hypothetical protein